MPTWLSQPVIVQSNSIVTLVNKQESMIKFSPLEKNFLLLRIWILLKDDGSYKQRKNLLQDTIYDNGTMQQYV